MRLHFCTVKETINQMKRQPTECENIFTNVIFYKGLTFKIYKELIQLTTKKRKKKKETNQNKTIQLKNVQRT